MVAGLRVATDHKIGISLRPIDVDLPELSSAVASSTMRR